MATFPGRAPEAEVSAEDTVSSPSSSAGEREATTRILVIADPLGATQHISFAQPLERAVAEGRVALRMLDEAALGPSPERRVAAVSSFRPTALVLSRYAGKAAPLIQEARSAGVPVIYHLDDDLLDPPLSLGTAKYAFHAAPARLAAIRGIIEASDIVYASTAPLREALLRHDVKTPIVAGDIYCSVAPAACREPLPATGPVIGYMGTAGHAQDLDLIMPEIEALMEEIPDLRFETFGTIAPPPRLARFAGRTGHHKAFADYGAFLARLAQLGWWVGLAPLEDSAFNRCKADTKWVEYTVAGIPTVASAGMVYDRSGADGAVRLVSDGTGWRSAIRDLLRDPSGRAALQARAHLRLARCYAHDLLEAQILNVVADAGPFSASRPAVPVEAAKVPHRADGGSNDAMPLTGDPG